MKKYDVPYRYYRCTLVGSWAFAALCIVATWLAFQIADHASIVFAWIVNIFLTFTLLILTVLLFISDRPDFRKKGILSLLAVLVHIAFILVVTILYYQGKIDSDETKPTIYLLPAIDTVMLIAIVILGIYFYSRGKFVFRKMRKDIEKAFGGRIADESAESPIPAPSNQPTKPARDEKTGIVSL